MAEPIKPTEPEGRAQQHPDRPRYEPPVVVHLGNSHAGQGGSASCTPVGSANQVNCVANGIGVPG
jgi:hypothetical protein